MERAKELFRSKKVRKTNVGAYKFDEDANEEEYRATGRTGDGCPAPSANCSYVRGIYMDEAKYYDYKDRELNIDGLANYIRTDLAGDLNKRSEETDPRLMNNYNQLQFFESKVQSLMKCMQSDLVERQCHASKIYNLQEDITTVRKEAREVADVAKDAKERAELLREPYSKTTRWELWLPIGRPLKKESVPVLLSIAIIFLILSLGMFLRLTSFGFSFGRLPSSTNGSAQTGFMKYQ